MGRFSSIRCVVFDLDDTLWTCEPVILNAEHALYEWLEQNYSHITDQYSIDDVRQQRAEFAIRNPQIAHDVTALRKQSLAELAQEFNYPVSLASEGLSLFRKHRNKVEPFDDALPTIKKVKEHFKTGVITNGNADLDVIGVREYFNFVVTAEEAGVAKPDRAIFEYAQNKAGLNCHELLYVGDNPTIDVLGSNNSGWKSLWFNPSAMPWTEETKPDAVIQCLSELPDLLSI